VRQGWHQFPNYVAGFNRMQCCAVLCCAVNLSAPFLLTEALLPFMAQDTKPAAAAAVAAAAAAAAAAAGGSSIVHIASTRALQSEPNCEVRP
jgi:NAD(P)-dependent dehydrogenase (short-subunit alcohol dehydrogenase family)